MTPVSGRVFADEAIIPQPGSAKMLMSFFISECIFRLIFSSGRRRGRCSDSSLLWCCQQSPFSAALIFRSCLFFPAGFLLFQFIAASGLMHVLQSWCGLRWYNLVYQHFSAAPSVSQQHVTGWLTTLTGLSASQRDGHHHSVTLGQSLEAKNISLKLEERGCQHSKFLFWYLCNCTSPILFF